MLARGVSRCSQLNTVRTVQPVRSSVRLFATAPTQAAKTNEKQPEKGVAAANQSKTNLRLYGVSGRYAHALYEFANETNSHAKVDADIKALSQLAKDDHDFQELLENPITSQSKRKAGLDKFFEQHKTSPATRHFFDLLIENRRSANTVQIFEDYGRLLASSRNELSGVITSAKELPAKQMQEIEKSVKKVFNTGNSKVVLTTKIDPSILGGFQIQVGEKYIDCSLRTEIDAIKRTMGTVTTSYFEKKYAELAAHQAE